jgi:hypothetical protein
MKLFSSKKRVAAIGALTAATLVGGGMAVAYWTNGGSGTGSATTGTTTDVTITASGPLGLVPGGPAQALVLNVDNPNSYSVRLDGLSVSIDTGSITCDGNQVDDAWFTLSDSTITSTTTVDAGVAADLDPSGVKLQMNDSTDNQNVCKDANVAFDLTVG